jgi:hypothetical protein
MHREQNILHDILRLMDRLPRSRKPTCYCPQNRCDSFEQAMVGDAVAAMPNLIRLVHSSLRSSTPAPNSFILSIVTVIGNHENLLHNRNADLWSGQIGTNDLLLHDILKLFSACEDILVRM